MSDPSAANYNQYEPGNKHPIGNNVLNNTHLDYKASVDTTNSGQ